MHELKRVVVTGLGALTPIGNDSVVFGKALNSGANGAGPITYFDATKFKTRFACELKGFDPLNFMERSEARKYDPFTQYALVATEEAIQHANLNFDLLNRNRIGVIWGSGIGGLLTLQEQIIDFTKGDGTPRFNPFLTAKMIIDIAAGIISIRHRLRGPNYATVSACATSSTALIDAFNILRLGKADILITGGSEAAINMTGIGAFNAARALSTANDNITSASRPFDVSRDGFVLGEGAGTLILEEHAHALKRGAPILAEIVGGGMSADAYHLTNSHPEGEGAYLAMTAALDDAGLKPQDIDYLNPHATSTPQGDISELRAIERVFGSTTKLHVSATKSMTGHLLGAAGAIEAIACIHAIQQGIVPPIINTKNIEPPYASQFPFPLNQPVCKRIDYAMTNNFGFGGHANSLIIKRYVE